MQTTSDTNQRDLEALQNKYDQLTREKTTLEQDFERRADQLNTLQRVTIDISSGLTLGETLQRLVSHAVRLLNASAGCVALTQGDGALEIMAVQGLPDSLLGIAVQLNQGMIGRVAATQTPLRINDYSGWGDKLLLAPDVIAQHGAIGVPMLYQDRAVGVICVFEVRPERTFSDDDETILEALAAPAAVATINAEYYSRAHRLSQRMSVLLATQLRLSTQTTHPDVMLDTVCQTVISLFGCNGAAIWRWRTNLLERTAVRFVDNVTLPDPTLAWNEGLPGRALAQSVPLVEDDPDQTGVTHAALPMMWQGQPVGVLVATYASNEMRFSRDDIDLLSLFCQSVGAALINANLLNSLQAERDRLETILSSTVDPVLVADQAGRLALINPIATSALQATVGQELIDLIGGQVVLPDTRQGVLESLENNEAFTFTLRYGHTIYSVRAAPLRQPEQGWVLVLRDVTGLKELEELKTRMIHMMSHDLKNPLTGIIGLSQMLVKKSDGFTTRQKDYLANIASSALRMEDLINNILDLEKASSSGLNTQEIDGEVLFRRLVSEYQTEVKNRAQTLTLEMPGPMPRLLVDEVQFYQALTNLVGNGLKYTPNEGHVAIKVSVDGKLLNVSVKDDGIGIPADKQDRLFERFYRVRSSETSHIPGTGLGLSLVKAVAEAHGGAVWVESEEKKGSTFHLQAPVVVV